MIRVNLLPAFVVSAAVSFVATTPSPAQSDPEEATSLTSRVEAMQVSELLQAARDLRQAAEAFRSIERLQRQQTRQLRREVRQLRKELERLRNSPVDTAGDS